ncbi:cell division protein ZapA [Acidithiobacillus ferrooxidans]|uniref:cell division protein ZapA n=1 Tax=Acidithiobacillus ferrooxidans TaxID=920 RepID=UPI0013D12BD8|nr:cell division protein ZapA [Acidithiobacillus ferrooxidans]MBU2856891.1 cell division protein ZapA [Acidithiobacillus ferrooxidans]MBU2862157.1 cell division protein ZapA [Acidithiobacillus ferrooxidans]MCR2829338.1 cell division protein ZapA [Acidithiobacillus ferrooxidans]
MPEATRNSATNRVNITLMGQSYQVPCLPEEQALLLEAVALLNQQLDAARAQGRTISKERTALMVAVNLAADLQRARQEVQARDEQFDRLENRLRRLVDMGRGAE